MGQSHKGMSSPRTDLEFLSTCSQLREVGKAHPKAIGDCHTAVHKMGAPRIATDIRIGTRTDRQITSGGNNGKVSRVEQILSEGQSQARAQGEEKAQEKQ